MKCKWMMRAAVVAGVIFAVNAAKAEVKTWIGGSNTWQTASCWNPEGVPAATDKIIIPSGTCEYVAGSDLTIQTGGSITIGNGARFFQSGKDSWIKIQGGSIVVESGGEFDMGTSGQILLTLGATATVKKGAVMKIIQLNISSDCNGIVQVEGTIDWKGRPIQRLQTDVLKNSFVCGDGAVNTNITEIQWVGACELGNMGTVYFQGFTAQSAGTRTNNVMVLNGGKYVVSKHATTKLVGPVTYAPIDTTEYGSWVDVPARAKVEFVLTDSSVTPENVFEKVKDYGTSAKNVLRRDGVIFEDVAAFRKAFMISGTTGDVHLNAKNGGLCIRIR